MCIFKRNLKFVRIYIQSVTNRENMIYYLCMQCHGIDAVSEDSIYIYDQNKNHYTGGINYEENRYAYQRRRLSGA